MQLQIILFFTLHFVLKKTHTHTQSEIYKRKKMKNEKPFWQAQQTYTFIVFDIKTWTKVLNGEKRQNVMLIRVKCDENGREFHSKKNMKREREGKKQTSFYRISFMKN